jgi:hypothetical protein
VLLILTCPEGFSFFPVKNDRTKEREQARWKRGGIIPTFSFLLRSFSQQERVEGAGLLGLADVQEFLLVDDEDGRIAARKRVM